MTSDRDLLRLYAEEGDEAAFAEVVRRHVDWVYSAARRLVAGDAHLAEDVAQSVFSDLARKAAKLSRYDAPGGWLHTATRFATIKAVDRERRRREREQEALAMNDTTNTPEIPWEQLRPVLDEAIGRLGESDRQAVVMRFFEGKSHREIGDIAGLSEDTARKRVERAVEKLRSHFARKGVTVPAVLLAEAIEANAVQAAPAGLAESLSATALVHGTAATGFLYVWLNSLLLMTTTTKVIIATAVVIVAVASYNYVIQTTSDTSPATATPAVAASKPTASVFLPKVPPQVVLPQQAAIAAVPEKNTSALPVARAMPAGSGSGVSTGQVDPKMEDAMAIMQPMKALYAEIYAALMETNNPDTALQKFQDLQSRIDELKTKIKGTPLEQVVGPALGQLTSAKTALQHGDIEGAQKIIQALNSIGQKVQEKVESTAGISIEQAATQRAASTDTSRN